ncbi:hypothetical protein [uncultured Williamsia sp.]|uniref:hypothetical protein n=1 Tax=uncultured Williamsia sp. TaxID=259311 RepID=UPI0026314004|nr:hypothetical protein [uncultured Williamsia sp.]
MTAPIDPRALGHPMATVTLFDDFATTGLVVDGLPDGWRKVRRDAEIVTVSDLWIDVAEAEQQADRDPAERFVSNALATAWHLADLPVPAEHLLEFAEAMTTGVTGWHLRHREVDPINECGSTLCGTLDSPFGPLVSNSHAVIQQKPDGSYVLAQLAVTALPHHGDALDAVRLRPV